MDSSATTGSSLTTGLNRADNYIYMIARVNDVMLVDARTLVQNSASTTPSTHSPSVASTSQTPLQHNMKNKVYGAPNKVVQWVDIEESVQCAVCHQAGINTMINCNYCGKWSHINCLGFDMRKLPTSIWNCVECFRIYEALKNANK